MFVARWRSSFMSHDDSWRRIASGLDTVSVCCVWALICVRSGHARACVLVSVLRKLCASAFVISNRLSDSLSEVPVRLSHVHINF